MSRLQCPYCKVTRARTKPEDLELHIRAIHGIDFR